MASGLPTEAASPGPEHSADDRQTTSPPVRAALADDVRELIALVASNADVIGALRARAHALSAQGRDRLSIMGLIWEVQIGHRGALSQHELGRVGDFADALLGQCHPRQVVRLAQDPPDEAELWAQARADGQRWDPRAWERGGRAAMGG